MARFLGIREYYVDASIYGINMQDVKPYDTISLNAGDFNAMLQNLYGADACYAIKMSQLDRIYDRSTYKAQLAILINELTRVSFTDDPNQERVILAAATAQRLNIKLQDIIDIRQSYLLQGLLPTYKKNLETIFFLVKDWPAEKKSAFILQLEARLVECTDGARVHMQLTELLYELTKKPSINSWLAELRLNIIQEFVENWVRDNPLSEYSTYKYL